MGQGLKWINSVVQSRSEEWLLLITQRTTIGYAVGYRKAPIAAIPLGSPSSPIFDFISAVAIVGVPKLLQRAATAPAGKRPMSQSGKLSLRWAAPFNRTVLA